MERLISSGDPALSASLHEVLTNLIVPDTSVIEKATSELRELNKHQSFVPSLFSVLCQSEDPEIRKLAAIIFRRKVSKQWKSFNRDVCNGVRHAVLECLLTEGNQKVCQSLCQVAASIAKHELSQTDGSWNDLFEVIERGARQKETRETAMYLLSVVCDFANQKLELHFINFLKLINEVVCAPDKDSLLAEFYAVKAFDSLIPYLGDEYVNLVRPLVTRCIIVIQRLLHADEDRASDLMEVFETLIETEVSFISPFVKDLVMFSLQVAIKSDFGDTTRVRALSTIRWIIKLKKRAIVKLRLVEPILDGVIPIVTSPSEEDGMNLSGEVESDVPLSSATCIIDDLALHLSPEKLYKALMPRIEVLIKSQDPYHKRGLVLILACLAEGTSEYIKSNYVDSFVKVVCDAAVDENAFLRYAALFALGQFAEHLQPNISDHDQHVMGVLFKVIKSTPESSAGLTRVYYALEMFVEGLDEEKITGYLPDLITHLFTTLDTCQNIHTRELIVSTFGAVANAAKEKLLPYLQDILSKLTVCLPNANDQSKEDDENAEKLNLLRIQTLDTLGVLARTVGKENFIPLAEDCLRLGMSLVENENTDDPDMRRSAYGLFSAISTIVEDKLSPFLPIIVKHMLDSIRSTEGVVPHYIEETNGETMSKDFSFLDDGIESNLSVEDDVVDDDDDDIEGFSVGSSYMEEKSDACEAIGEIAKNTKAEFGPYLRLAFEEVFLLVDFPHPDVRKAAIASSGELTMCAYKLKQESFSEFVGQTFPVICKTISKETERQVVMGAIATVNQMVDCCKMDTFVNGEESLKSLMEALLLVMNGKSACHDAEDDVDDEQQAEYDEMLIEYCGEILPVLASSIGAATFLPYFIGFLPALLAKTKPVCTSSERSFSAGTIAETFQKLGPGSSKEVVAHVIPRFLELTKDREDEVRNNAIFGIGVVLQQSDGAGLPYYQLALSTLSQVLSTEKSRLVIDNILGAVSRMIISNRSAIPVSEVVPVLLSHLPIKEDHNEDGTVYSCLSCLLHDDLDATIKIRIISVFLQVIDCQDVDQEIRISITNELRSTQQRDPNLISQACGSIGPDLVTKLQAVVQ